MPVNPTLAQFGIHNELQAVQLITQLEEICELLAAALEGDPTILTTRAAAFDHSILTASASAQLAHITKNLRNPPTNQPPVTSDQ